MVRWGDCLHIKTAKLLGRWKTTIQLKYVIGILVRIKWFSIRWRWKYMLFFHVFSKWPDRELNDEQNEIAEHRNFAFEFFFCFEHDVHMKLLANKGRRRFIFNHLGARFVFRLHKQNRRHQFIVPQPHHSHARRSYIICDAFFSFRLLPFRISVLDFNPFNAGSPMDNGSLVLDEPRFSI